MIFQSSPLFTFSHIVSNLIVIVCFYYFLGQRIVKRIRQSLFGSIMKQEIAFFDKTRTGELINRLSTDTSVVGLSITNNISDGLRAVMQASIGVSMMVVIFSCDFYAYVFPHIRVSYCIIIDLQSYGYRFRFICHLI